MAIYEEIEARILNSSYYSKYLSQIDFESLNDRHNFLISLIATIQGVKRHPKTIYENMPKDFVVIDLETTGFSNEDEIIQLSVEKIKNNKVDSTFDTFVKPKNKKVSTQIMYLTGIFPEQLDQAPSIDEVREDFEAFIGDFPVLGHNIGFDSRFLLNVGVDISERIFCDTVEYAKTKLIDTPNYKLVTLKDYFGITNISHNALEDCDTTFQIYEKLLNNQLSKHFNNEVIPQVFEGLKFCVTGNFKKISRDQVKKEIIARGGRITATISKNTDYFVDGVQTANNLIDGVHSSKELKYKDLKSDDAKVQLLTEDEFIALLNQHQSSEESA